jgi:hypothetical protein
MDNFTTNFVNYLRASIFPGIITGFAQKGHVVTEDELLSMIQQSGLNNPPMVASVASVPLPGEARTAKPKSNKTSSVIDSIEPGRCHYRFSKGDHRNKYCGKPVTSGSDYCPSCLKNNKTLAKQLATMGTVPTTTVTPTVTPTIPGYGPPSAITETTVPLIPNLTTTAIPPIPSMPSIPSIPGIPSIPVIPSITGGTQLPPGIPQLPTIRPLN